MYTVNTKEHIFIKKQSREKHFANSLAPIGGRLLCDELNVEEGTLARAVDVSRGGATDNPICDD